MNVPRGDQGRLLPTGECWCGCEGATAAGNFFLPGHDRFAEAALINIKHGSVAEFLVAHGYGPGGRNTRLELEDWRKRGGLVR